jgi:hypothetical protein
MTNLKALRFVEVSPFIAAVGAIELEATFQSLAFPNELDTLALLGFGVPFETFNQNWVGEYDPIRVANILPLPKNRFEIVSSDHEHSRKAALIRVFNSDAQIIDLLAVDLNSKWTALFLGSTAVVGEQNFTREPHIGDGVLVHRNGASFLASGRRGTLVFDPIKAREHFMVFTGPSWPILVEDEEMARRLGDKLVWNPSIKVSKRAFEFGARNEL